MGACKPERFDLKSSLQIDCWVLAREAKTAEEALHWLLLARDLDWTESFYGGVA